MGDPRPPELGSWLRTHHGVVTRFRLLELGFASSSVGHLVRSGRLRRLWPGAFVSADVEVARPQLMSAICQLHPWAAIGFTTAGAQWGLRGMSDPVVHVLVPHAMTPAVARDPRVRVHRCRRIDPVDLAGRRSDGVRLTSPPRTLFDSAALLPVDASASSVEHALSMGLCTMPTIMSTLSRLRHPDRPGALRFEAVLASRRDLRGVARSVLEMEVRTGVAAAGLPQPILNMPFRLADGSPIVIDLAWPDHRVAVEVDHPFWHDGEREAARDKRRDRKLAAMGWISLRIPKIDVETRLAEAVADVGEVLVLRGWSPRTA
ncbi:hypothetical protein [Actinomarinicola tropica]|uniref:DUF559 domain-containing protein n=1 Tax=Actinomarinicola tropica TaxID=2789776 RepID=A0A5Q2RP78_9ACTN|nr:hypothetical protein [Actinomarinicola tropica]QGG96752.1 hypothetical protein GH723_17535 [Actinomarinicola tropica]